MKTIIAIFIFLILSILLYGANVSFENSKARPDGDNIVVEWSVSVENDLKQYEIQRASKSGQYKKIGDHAPRGSGFNYRFVDFQAFIKSPKEQQKNNTVQENIDYIYRVKAISNSGEIIYSQPLEVTHKISSVKRTWGMLKELFR